MGFLICSPYVLSSRSTHITIYIDGDHTHSSTTDDVCRPYSFGSCPASPNPDKSSCDIYIYSWLTPFVEIQCNTSHSPASAQRRIISRCNRCLLYITVKSAFLLRPRAITDYGCCPKRCPHICVNICPSKVSSLWDKRISSKRVQICQAIRADRRSSKSSSHRRMNNARSFPFGRPSRGRLDPDAFVRRKVSSRNAVHYWN